MFPLFPNAIVLKAFVLGLALASSALMSCSPSPEAGGGIGGTGSVSVSSVSSGAVTKLGSVFVSGTKYDNSNAFYCMDDEPCSIENDLKVGMVVQVHGTAQSLPDGSVIRIADTITFQQTAAGVVQSIGSDGSSLVVSGQFVAVNPKTVIDESIPGGAISNLRPGVDVIQISGLVAGDGHIVATLIMKRTDIAYLAVEGIVKNHDVEGKHFEIGQLVVDYSSADVHEMTVGNTTNWNDRLVYVRGDEWLPLKAVPYGITLSATRVKPLGLTVDESAEAKLEGFLTKVTQTGAMINNHPIRLSSATVFEDGRESDFVLGAHVLIHGTLAQGVLDAQLVSFKENVLLESNLESINIQSGTLTLAGFPGVLIKSDAKTILEKAGRASRFEDLQLGDHLKIHAKFLADQRMLATELDLTEPSTAIVLQASVQSAADPRILLANMSIDTSLIPDHDFVGSFGPIGRKIFFEKALTGRNLWGKGMLAAGVVTWSSFQINE